MITVIIFGLIGFFIGLFITRTVRRIPHFEYKNYEKVLDKMFCSTTIGAAIGVGVSFWCGSVLVEKKVVTEKYVISPLVVNTVEPSHVKNGNDIYPAGVNITRKIIALNIGQAVEAGNYCNYYLIPVKNDKGEMIFLKEFLKKEDFNFSTDSNERYIKFVKRTPCKKNMWILFFCTTKTVKKTVVLQKNDWLDIEKEPSWALLQFLKEEYKAPLSRY